MCTEFERDFLHEVSKLLALRDVCLNSQFIMGLFRLSTITLLALKLAYILAQDQVCLEQPTAA